MKRLLFHEAQPGEVRLEGPRFHHLVHVLRATVGDTLELFDGRGTSFASKLVEIGEHSARLQVGTGVKTAPARSVSIVQGLPKADKFELILQKCTELGASAFFPVGTERSIVKLSNLSEGKTARWQSIVEEAARQCGRSEVPTVHAPVPLREGTAALPEGTQLLILDEEERATRLSHVVQALPEQTPIALLIGPEGGFSRAEIQSLQGTPVSLGPSILRTERRLSPH